MELTHVYVFTGKQCRITNSCPGGKFTDYFKGHRIGHGDVFIEDEDGEKWLVNQIFLDRIKEMV